MNVNYHSIWPPPEQPVSTLSPNPARPVDARLALAAAAREVVNLPSPASSALRSILAITDLQQDADAVLEKGAQLAKANGIALTIAYYNQKGGPSGTQAIVRLIRRARHLRNAFEIPVEVPAYHQLSDRDLARFAARHDLVCVHRDQLLYRNPIWRANLVRLLLDKARAQVLALTGDGSLPADRTLLAAKTRCALKTQFAALSRLGPQEAVELLHITRHPETPLPRLGDVPPGVMADYLKEKWQAVHAGFESAGSAVRPPPDVEVRLTMVHGDVRSRIRQHLADSGASLLVLGWHRRSGLSAWLRERMVVNLLRESLCAALIVPVERVVDETLLQPEKGR